MVLFENVTRIINSEKLEKIRFFANGFNRTVESKENFSCFFSKKNSCRPRAASGPHNSVPFTPTHNLIYILIYIYIGFFSFIYILDSLSAASGLHNRLHLASTLIFIYNLIYIHFFSYIYKIGRRPRAAFGPFVLIQMDGD